MRDDRTTSHADRAVAAARGLAAHGYVTLPLTPRGNVPHPMLRTGWRFCTCTGMESSPVVGSNDPRDVHVPWDVDPTANLGVVTGAPSRLLVIDVDVHGERNGLLAFAAWRDVQASVERRVLPDAPSVRSPSGGRHIWFTLPPDAHVRTHGDWLEGVDVKACGGQVAAPPSVRHGGSYAWESLRDVPPAPAWLLADVATRRERRGGAWGERRGGDPLPDTEAIVVGGFAPGSRDRDCHRLACRLLGRGEPEERVRAVVRAAWEQTPGAGRPTPGVSPFGWDEAEKCIRSARRFIARRRDEEARLARSLIGG